MQDHRNPDKLNIIGVVTVGICAIETIGDDGFKIVKEDFARSRAG